MGDGEAQTLWKVLLQRVKAGPGVGELQLVENREQDGTFTDSKEKQKCPSPPLSLLRRAPT